LTVIRETFVVQCALKLAPLFFVRPGELRHAEWSEINFEKNAEWNIPASKMKMERGSSCAIVTAGNRDIKKTSLAHRFRTLFISHQKELLNVL
jgi:integrase